MRSAALAVTGVALVALVACSDGGPAPEPRERASASGSSEPSTAGGAADVTWPEGAPADRAVVCPPATVEVSTAAGLRRALDEPEPGTVVGLAPGTYEGGFAASGRATAAEPVFVCGPADAVLRGPGSEHGTVLALEGVEHWRLVGFTVRSGRKGVMADAVQATVLQGLTVTDVGDEAVHLRSSSSGNLVRDNVISDTGQRRAKFGEGVYVGSAESNWCRFTGCEPDRSDHNVVVGNDISATTAESVDVKEGTTGGVVADNDLDGSSLSAADSWVDVKGNGWLVRGNRGASSPGSGFQTHQQLDGWGTGNVFDANRADVGGDGWGVELRPVADNRVTCTNVVRDAAQGLSNTACG